eukprot:3688495-Amphidinium_carterae.1
MAKVFFISPAFQWHGWQEHLREGWGRLSRLCITVVIASRICLFGNMHLKFLTYLWHGMQFALALWKICDELSHHSCLLSTCCNAVKTRIISLKSRP